MRPMLAVLLAALESDEDKQKFTEIYELYHVQMEQTAIRILKDQHDAEDAVQNAFMQIIRHFEKIYEIPCEKLDAIIWANKRHWNQQLILLKRRQNQCLPPLNWACLT